MSEIRLLKTLGARILLSERRDTFLSAATVVALIGVAFGVAALFITLSVIGGFQQTYKTALLKFNSHIVVTKADEMEDADEVVNRMIPPELRAEILGWNPFLYREGMLISGSRMWGVVIKGVDFERYGNLSQMKIQLNPAFRERVPAKMSLVLGRELASRLGETTHEVNLLFPEKGRDGIGTPRRFRLVGTFESGLYEYDAAFAFVPLREAQQFFRTGGKVSGIEIWLADPDRAPLWVERLNREFTFPYVVLGWRDINENLFRALEVERAVFFVLMIFLTAVASLNLLASLIMLILRKARSIAILRTLGLSWSTLRKIFLFDGLLIGCAGLGLGLLIALVTLLVIEKWLPLPLAAEVYFIERVPVQIAWENFAWVTVSVIALIVIGCSLTLRGLSRMPVLSYLAEMKE